MIEAIHLRAVEISRRYLRAEAELVCILQKVEEHRVFVRRGHASLFAYVVSELGLSESVAYGLITVARKVREVPELGVLVGTGEISLSNARRVAAVLTSGNQSEWLKKASELTARQLEKEVVKIKPEAATRERASYVTPERVRLELGMSEAEMLKLRRIQDLLSQKTGRAVSLEETISTLGAEFLKRHDPVEKAKRQVVKKSPSASLKTLVTGRVPLPAALKHQVNLRDERRCTYVNQGKRCNQSRWIEIHHIQPVSQGGPNTLENLTTLCSSHHDLQHVSQI
jgi:hypothetical protein